MPFFKDGGDHETLTAEELIPSSARFIGTPGTTCTIEGASIMANTPKYYATHCLPEFLQL